MRQKLLSNIFDEDYKPEIKTLNIEQPFHLVSDAKSVCVSNKSGSISNYNFHSLEHIWTVKGQNHLLINFVKTNFPKKTGFQNFSILIG